MVSAVSKVHQKAYEDNHAVKHENPEKVCNVLERQN